MAWCRARMAGVALAAAAMSAAPGAADKLTYHHDAQRSGWNDAESRLTPQNVASGRFGLLWQSPPLDGFEGVPPRLFATPLHVSGLAFADGARRSVAYVVTSAGTVYAITTAREQGKAPGAILWRTRLTGDPCAKGEMGNLATPVIDRARGRLYVTSCTGEGWAWRVHALDLRSGDEAPGWPLGIDAAAINRPGVSRNGGKTYIDGEVRIQRGALNLNRDGTRLYVAFGPDKQGWLVSVDTAAPGVASAFSSTAEPQEEQGGMWGSAGASLDREGRVHIATGANFGYTLAKRGIAGVFPESAHSWGQSILQFSDEPGAGLRLIGTYTPFNYCQTAASDIDIGGSGAVLIDLPAGSSSTPQLLALGGGKQGNAYLLDRDRMPGGTERRRGCSSDPASDTSLLAPEVQIPLASRGPVNAFGPYSDSIGMSNSAKSRSTLAQFRDFAGRHWLYLSGSSKTGADYSINVPPGLVRVRLLTAPGRPAFLHLDQAEVTQTLQNPGSPVVSSNRGRGGIVWLLDPNAPRTMNLFQSAAPRAVLYAFDALTLRLLWKSGEEMFPTGKYNEPTVVDGMVLVGTDRLQAFGLRSQPRARPARAVAADAPSAAPGQALYDALCSACHAKGADGVPTRAALRQLPEAQVIAALTSGKMSPMVSGLSAAQIEAIAQYLVERR